MRLGICRPGLFSASNNANIGTKPVSQNFLIYWDADETRELLDRTQIDKLTNTNGTLTRLLTATGVASNNGTKATPALTADLFDSPSGTGWLRRRCRTSACGRTRNGAS